MIESTNQQVHVTLDREEVEEFLRPPNQIGNASRRKAARDKLRAALAEGDGGEGLKDAVKSLHTAVAKCRAASIGPEYIDQVVQEKLGRQTILLVVLWARLADDRYPPQFVAAFTEGEYEAMAELHAERRAAAEQEFRDLIDEDVTAFFTTFERVPRATLNPNDGEAT